MNAHFYAYPRDKTHAMIRKPGNSSPPSSPSNDCPTTSE